MNVAVGDQCEFQFVDDMKKKKKKVCNISGVLHPPLPVTVSQGSLWLDEHFILSTVAVHLFTVYL